MKFQLLSKGQYKNIPDKLTIGRIPTVSELDYVSGDEFDRTLIDVVLPAAVEEKINFNDLLEVDYQLLCRAVRIANFGPYHTVNVILCDSCGTSHRGEYQVDLTTIECVPLPDKFTNEFKISKDEFVDFNSTIIFKLPTIQKILNAHKDKAFQLADGRINRELARICYMISEVGSASGLTPVEIKLKIETELSAADYKLLKGAIQDSADFGLRAGGRATCPECADPNAAFISISEDRYFRPTLDNLRKWKQSRTTSTPK